MTSLLNIIISVVAIQVLISVNIEAQLISLESVSNTKTESENVFTVGTTPEFLIRLTSNSQFYYISNGFRIYSDDGAQWTTTIPDTTQQGWRNMFDLLFEMNSYNSNGTVADTVFYKGTSLLGTGLESSFDEVSFIIRIGPIVNSVDNIGKTICIDSATIFPNGDWIWANPLVSPQWDGPYCYKIKDEITDISMNGTIVSDKISLMQNYPNPFNPITTFEFKTPEKSEIVFKIYNLTGQLIYEKTNIYPAGLHTINWDGSDYSSGLYFYTLQSHNISLSKKMLLLK